MESELILRWMTSTGTGSVRKLRESLEWLAQTVNAQSNRYRANRWIRDVQDLGYIEVDWTSDRWQIAAATIARLPRIPELAFVTGARGPQLRATLEAGDVAMHEMTPDETDRRVLPLPPAIFLQADAGESFVDLAERADLNYGGFAAMRIARHLPRVGLGAEAAPPSRDSAEHAERYSADSGRFEAATIDRSGLYRFRTGWRTSFLVLREKRWYHSTLDAGVFSEASREGRGIMRWRDDGADSADPGGTLRIRSRVAPPPLHARCLNLCSGQPPEDDGTGLSYDNVPRMVAVRVAASLGQTLSIH